VVVPLRWLKSIYNRLIRLTLRLLMIGPVGGADLSSFIRQQAFKTLPQQSRLIPFCIVLVRRPSLYLCPQTSLKKSGKVIEKFDDFFKVRRNVIFEWARFNRRSQMPGESVEQYIVELYNLAEHCNYGNLTSEMIRDRLVVGIQDLSLSERLQLDPELTLEKAKKVVRQREAVKEQQQVLKGAGSGSLDEMQPRYGKPTQGKHLSIPVNGTLRQSFQNPDHVHNVAGDNTQETNVLLGMPYATVVIRKATTEPVVERN